MLTPRQLLILVLTVCRDAEYHVLPKQKVLNTIRDLRLGKPDCVPELNYILSGAKHCCAQLEEAFNSLHLSGAIVFNPTDGTIAITDAMTEAEVYKPLLGKDREELTMAMNPYVADFVRDVTRRDPKAPKATLDPQKY